MNIFRSLSRLFNRTLPPVDITNTAAIGEYLNIRQSAAGVRVTPEVALGSPAIAAACRLICNHVASMDCNLYRIGEHESRELATDHWAYWLMAREPHPLYTPYQLKHTLQLHAILWGNAYALVTRDESARPTELLILDPDVTTLEYQQETGTYYYRTSVNGVQFSLPYSDVLHIQNMSGDGLLGYLTYAIMRDSIGEGLAISRYSQAYFKNNARPSVVVEVPLEVKGEEKLQAFKASWQNWLGSPDHNHRPAFLPSGAKVQTLGGSSEANQMAQLKESDLVACANIIGVPPSKLGSNVNTSYGSLEQDNLSFLTDYLNPWLIQWEQAANKVLLTEAQKIRATYFFEFDRSRLLQADPEKAAAIDVLLLNNGIKSWEEVRHRNNLPTQKVDNQEWRIPSGVTIEGEEPPQPQAPAVAQVQAQEDTQEPQAQGQEDQLRALTTATLGRLFERIKKSGKPLADHREVFFDSLGMFPNSSKLYAQLSEELDAVLPEQRPAIIEQWNKEQLCDELL